MSIPAVLYDASVSPEQYIATVRLRIERRATPVVGRNKMDAGWETLASDLISFRLVCDGITSSAWAATLIERWHSGTLAAYRVALDDGDEHSGTFLVAELDEAADAEERRRFRLVLRSSGAVAYTPS